MNVGNFNMYDLVWRTMLSYINQSKEKNIGNEIKKEKNQEKKKPI